MRESQCLGFATMYDSNQPAQLHRLARILKFGYRKCSQFTFQKATNKVADQTVQMIRLVCTFVVCIQQCQVFSQPGPDNISYVLQCVMNYSKTATKIDKTKILMTNSSLMCSPFCITFDLHEAIIAFENQFLIFLRVAILNMFYCILY